MPRQYWKPSNMLYPVPAVLVSCADEEGRANVMTAAWAGTVCSDPVMLSVSIRKERFSHDIIKRTGEFTVCLTTEAMAKAVDYVGVRSGRDIDKFALEGELKLTKIPSEKIAAPVREKERYNAGDIPDPHAAFGRKQACFNRFAAKMWRYARGRGGMLTEHTV